MGIVARSEAYKSLEKEVHKNQSVALILGYGFCSCGRVIHLFVAPRTATYDCQELQNIMLSLTPSHRWQDKIDFFEENGVMTLGKLYFYNPEEDVSGLKDGAPDAESEGSVTIVVSLFPSEQIAREIFKEVFGDFCRGVFVPNTFGEKKIFYRCEISKKERLGGVSSEAGVTSLPA